MFLSLVLSLFVYDFEFLSVRVKDEWSSCEINMAVLNEFLLGAEHEGIFENCFCSRCREEKAGRLRELTSAQLYDLIQHLPLKEETRLGAGEVPERWSAGK